MSYSNRSDDVIEMYLNGALSEIEKVEFETELKADTVLQKKLEFYQLTNKLIVKQRLNEVGKLIENEATKIRKERGKSAIVKKYLFTVLGLIVAGCLLFFSINKKKNNSENTGLIATSTKIEKVIAEKDTVLSVPQRNGLNSVVQKENKNSTAQSSSENNFADALKSGNAFYPVKDNNDGSDLPSAGSNTIENKVIEAGIKQESRKEPTDADDCKSVTISAEIKSKNPCKGEKNGELIVVSAKGGKAPYKYRINEGEWYNSNSFSELEGGTYVLEVTDYNQCKTKAGAVSLHDINCRKNFEFNPFTGQELELPYYEKSGTISIFDKTGRLFSQKKLIGGEKNYWDGKSDTGEIVAQYFVFIIQYVDGSVQEGSITVTQ